MAKKDDAEEKVSAYQAHRKSLTRAILKALVKGTNEIDRRMSDLLEKAYSASSFKNRADAIKWLNTPATQEVIDDLYRQIHNLPDGEREDALRRMMAESYKHGWTINKAIKETVAIQTKLIVRDVLKNGNHTVHQLSLEAYGRSMFSIQKTVNVGFSLRDAPTRLLEKSVKSTFNASRTVGYIKTVTEAMRTEFLAGVMAGKSTDEIRFNITKAQEKDVWVSKAYARTMLTEVSNEVEKEAMEDAGIDCYEYVCTLDELTCPVCGALDGRTFKLVRSTPGTNFPPMHRNCRCTTSPVMSKGAKERMTRRYKLTDEKGRAYYDNVPASMTYTEWKAKYMS